MEKENIMTNFYKLQNERLEALRKLVKLNPVDYIRVSNARKQAERVRELTIEYYPYDSIDADYSVANDLEYTLRLNTFIKKYQKSFYEYQKLENENYCIEDFAIDLIDKYLQNMYNDNRKVKQK